MFEQSATCFKHGKPYQLIGVDKHCEMDCRICVDCLRLEGGHKRGMSNHETISIDQLNQHFSKLQHHSYEPVIQCKESVEQYFRTLEALIREELFREKQRIGRMITKIMLGALTRDPRQAEAVLSMAAGDYSSLSCRQVAEVSQQLLSFQPDSKNPTYRHFLEYVNSKQSQLSSRIADLTNTSPWKGSCLSDIERDVPILIPQPLKISRVKTEEDSPKRTIKRSVRKHPAKLVKDLSVDLKKPLDLPNSYLLDTREEALFLARLFEPRSVKKANLLYRASQNNFSIGEFHRKCDGETDTLVIVRTQFNKTIGGYTPIPWKSSANTLHADIRGESFLFSLSLKQKMYLVDQNSAVFNSMNFGPTFGAGADLAICHRANTEGSSYSEFPYSYGNNRYKEWSQHSTTLFTGQKRGSHFLVKEWEVWKLTLND